MESTSFESNTLTPIARNFSVDATELDTAPGMRSFIDASASMNLLTVDPVPTPTISPGTTYCSAACPTRAFSSSCVISSIMSLLPYQLARPFLFGRDPEAAHELTLHSLAMVQG